MFSVHGKQPTNSQALVKTSLDIQNHWNTSLIFRLSLVLLRGSNTEKHVRSPEFLHPGMLIERSMNNQAYPETKTISSDESLVMVCEKTPSSTSG